MTTRVYIHPYDAHRGYYIPVDLPEVLTAPAGHGVIEPGYEVTLYKDTVIMPTEAKYALVRLIRLAKLPKELREDLRQLFDISRDIEL